MNKAFQKFKNNFGKIIVTAGLIAATTMPVFADTIATTNASVNFRDGEGMKSNIIEILPKDATLTVLDDSTDWVKVEYNGKTGYVYKSYLKTETVKTGIVEIGNGSLNIRQKPSTQSKVLGKLHTGDKIKIEGETSNWYKINYEGKTGYVSKKYVKVSSTEIGEVEQCDEKAGQATIACNVRTGPSTSYSKMGTIVKGQIFSIKGKCSNGWYLIDFGSKEGYISPKYLELFEKSDSNEDEIGYAKIDAKSYNTINIRSGQSTKLAILDKISNGEQVQLVKDPNPVKGWTKVRYNNLNGYVSTKYLIIKFISVEPDEEIKVEKYKGVFKTYTDCNIRTGPSTSYQKMGTIAKGQDFYVKGKCSNGWYLIDFGSKDGYISSKYIIEKDVGSDNDDEIGRKKVINQSGEKVSLRDGQSKDSKVLDKVPLDTYVYILKDPNPVQGWTKIRYNNLDGYIETKYLKENDPIPNEPPVIKCVDELTYTVGDKFNKDDLKLEVTDKEYDDDFTPRATIDTSKLDMTKAGTYVILIQATDDEGATTTKEVKVIVKEKEVQGYEVNSLECRQIIKNEMYRLVNKHREANGRTPYTILSILENTAYTKSKDMATKDYFDHEYNGQMIWEYEDCADADGENIALCVYNAYNGKLTEDECKDLANELFNMWKESPGHNAAMIDKYNKSIGFDLYLLDRGNGVYTVYATQEFRVTNN